MVFPHHSGLNFARMIEDTLPIGRAPGDAGLLRTLGPILVVEDDPRLRFLIRNILAARGHAVTEAAGGAEALDRAAYRDAPRLVITELDLPDMSGADLILGLRAGVPGLKAIFLAARPDALPAIPGFAATDGALITKPFTGTGLWRQICSLLTPAGDAVAVT